MNYFDHLKEYLPCIREGIEGENLEEIEKVEFELNIKFPAAYKEYLILIGKNSGRLHAPDQCNLNEIVDIQKEANEIYERGGHNKINSNDLVIILHLNYSFLYLVDIDKYDNPPVWIYIQGDEIHDYKEAETFTGFIYKCLTIEALHNKRLFQKFKDNGIEIEIPSWMQ